MHRFMAVDRLCKKCVRPGGYSTLAPGDYLYPVNNSWFVPNFIRFLPTNLSAVFYAVRILWQGVLHTFHSTNNNHHLYINHIIV